MYISGLLQEIQDGCIMKWKALIIQKIVQASVPTHIIFPVMMFPEDFWIATCPETNKSSPACIAWLYGPIGSGALAE